MAQSSYDRLRNHHFDTASCDNTSTVEVYSYCLQLIMVEAMDLHKLFWCHARPLRITWHVALQAIAVPPSIHFWCDNVLFNILWLYDSYSRHHVGELTLSRSCLSTKLSVSMFDLDW